MEFQDASADGQASSFHDAPVPLSSPWGNVQECRVIASGLWSVSTGGHGGTLISEERREAMPAWASHFKTFSGQPTAFEEDLDWAVPCAAWAQEFSLEDCLAAIRTIQGRVSYFTERGLDVDAALQRLATAKLPLREKACAPRRADPGIER
jgi:hypothetical protein